METRRRRAFANRPAQIILGAGLTQGVVGQNAGLPQSTVSYVLAGARPNKRPEVLAAIARLAGQDVADQVAAAIPRPDPETEAAS